MTCGFPLLWQVALTIGTIVLGVWVFSQLQSTNRCVRILVFRASPLHCWRLLCITGHCLLLGNRGGGGGGRRDQPGSPQQRGSRRQPLPEPKRRMLLPGGFSIGGDSDSELADVWFEGDDVQREPRRRRRI